MAEGQAVGAPGAPHQVLVYLCLALLQSLQADLLVCWLCYGIHKEVASVTLPQSLSLAVEQALP